MTSKLIVIIAVSLAAVLGMFILGKLLDRSGTESPQNGGVI